MAEEKINENQINVSKRLSPEQVIDLIHESGIELSDEELEKVQGGWSDSKTCPPGQHDYQYKGFQPSYSASGVFKLYVCSKCGDGVLE